jgi:hypothetical protein
MDTGVTEIEKRMQELTCRTNKYVDLKLNLQEVDKP